METNLTKKLLASLALVLLLTPLASAGILRHSAKGVKKAAHAGKAVAKHSAHAAKVVVY